MKPFLFFAVGLFGLALVFPTAQSQSKRQLDDRVPAHLPIKIKIKKENEERFQDLNNDHWPRDFVLEVKNTGDRPIYALGLVWTLTDVRAADGNIYGATLNYGRRQFITVPGEMPKPEDVPINPGETHVFKLSKPRLEGLESFAQENHLTLKTVMVWLNYLCFGDGTCLEGPEGQNLQRKKPVAFYSPRALATIELDYKLSKKSDEYGNQFRYRAKLKDTNGAQLGRWAWDVLLLTQ